MLKQFKSAVNNAIPEYFCLFDYMENICSVFLICFNDSAGVQNLPLANTTPAVSAAQTLSNVQQLVKQTTQLMPCSWQLYEPQYFVFSVHLHPHIPSVQCAERVSWRGALIVKGTSTKFRKKLPSYSDRDLSQSLEVRVNKEAVSSFVLKRRHLVKKGGDERQPQGNLNKQKRQNNALGST